MYINKGQSLLFYAFIFIFFYSLCFFSDIKNEKRKFSIVVNCRVSALTGCSFHSLKTGLECDFVSPLKKFHSPWNFSVNAGRCSFFFFFKGTSN